MIKSFRDKPTAAVFNGYRPPNLPPEIAARAKVKLQVLQAATNLQDLKVPYANHLEQLRDERRGQWSIRINRQWRVCFTWRENDAYEVEIVDYH
ncbi:plasmid maintenance system killer protein [Planctomycetales bacterium]|nr:plasmid maintenance system killer protein [Planctomycetales bacterium]GHV19200.1 plasmid maintenance system killer protein [Planctomycetales bacterium]